MGNANSSAIFLQSEAKPACAIPEQSLSPVQQFPEFAASSKKESSGSRASSRQVSCSRALLPDAFVVVFVCGDSLFLSWLPGEVGGRLIKFTNT